MTKDEALKLALEALEEAWYHVGTFQPTEKAIDLYDEARTAIKEALAQPEQEPVAWMCADESLINKGYARFSHVCMGDWKIPVYTTPPQRTWVGLKDDDEIDWDGGDLKSFVRAIEAKLRSKNNV